MNYFGIIDKNVAAIFHRNEILEILLTCFCNILCYMGRESHVNRCKIRTLTFCIEFLITCLLQVVNLVFIDVFKTSQSFIRLSEAIFRDQFFSAKLQCTEKIIFELLLCIRFSRFIPPPV